MPTDELAMLGDRAVVFAGPPIKDIHSFLGNLTLHPPPDDGSGTPAPTLHRSAPTVGDLLGVSAEAPDQARSSADSHRPDTIIAMSQQPQVAPLTAENVLWANTVLAAGTAVGMVVYTGRETRAVMNTRTPAPKSDCSTSRSIVFPRFSAV